MAKTFALYEVADTDPAVTVSVPSPDTAGLGAMVTVKDMSGDASTNPITVSPVSGTIEGSASYEISTDGGAVSLLSDGAVWLVVSTNGAGGGGGSVTGSDGVTVAASNATNDLVTGDSVAQVDAVSAGTVHVANPSASLDMDGTGGIELLGADTVSVRSDILARLQGPGGARVDIGANGLILQPTGTFTLVASSGDLAMSGGGNASLVGADNAVLRAEGSEGDATVQSLLAGARLIAGDAALVQGASVTVSGANGVFFSSTGGAVVLQNDVTDLVALHDGVGSAQKSPVANVSGGVVVDAEMRTAFNAMLAYWRLRGDIDI